MSVEEFDKWYKENESRFHSGQFSTREEALSAWIDSRIKTLEDVQDLINDQIKSLERDHETLRADELRFLSMRIKKTLKL